MVSKTIRGKYRTTRLVAPNSATQENDTAKVVLATPIVGVAKLRKITVLSDIEEEAEVDRWSEISSDEDMQELEPEVLMPVETIVTPEEEELPITIAEIRVAQHSDLVIGKIITWMQAGLDCPEVALSYSREVKTLWVQRASMIIQDDILYRKYSWHQDETSNWQIVLPRELKERALKHVHGGTGFGHFGNKRTNDRLKEYFYWPGYQADVRRTLRQCDVCCRYRRGPQRKQGEMQAQPAGCPMEKFHIDLVGKLPRSSRGYAYILTGICTFTKYLVTVPLRDKTALAVAKALVKHIYLVYGAPELQVSDNGGEFVNEVLQNVTKLLGIGKAKITAWRPQSNGVVERVHSTMNAMFAKSVQDNQRDWCTQLKYITYAYNTSVHRETTYSPFYLMFGRRPKMNLDLLLETPSELYKDLDDYTETLQARMRNAFEIVGLHLEQAFDRNKLIYDTKVRPREFEVGELVWLYNPAKKPRCNNKWRLKQTGPHVIVKRITTVNYLIRFTPRSREKTVHVDRLTKYCGEISDEWKKYLKILLKKAKEIQPTDFQAKQYRRSNTPTAIPDVGQEEAENVQSAVTVQDREDFQSTRTVKKVKKLPEAIAEQKIKQNKVHKDHCLVIKLK